MYGTVAGFRLKPGNEEKMKELLRKYEQIEIPGFIAEYVYKSGEDPNDYYMVVLFEDETSYMANADSPEQDTRYREFAALLDREPEWHDGQIIDAVVRKQVVATGYGGWQARAA